MALITEEDLDAIIDSYNEVYAVILIGRPPRDDDDANPSLMFEVVPGDGPVRVNISDIYIIGSETMGSSTEMHHLNSQLALPVGVINVGSTRKAAKPVPSTERQVEVEIIDGGGGS